ncbi:unnamed protein product [Penicillium olsonii]|nr:unnamed protein product [Penicillium olsonii]
MLRAGANVNLRSPNRAQLTALLEAVKHKHTSVVQILLESGALPDAADARSRRPLALATNGRSDVAITKLLLENGARADSVVFDKHAPLFEAVRSSQESKVALLLKHGADTHVLDRRTGMNLVHIAASKNATSGIINILIDSGIQIESQDDMGRTPLQVAAENSCTRAVRLLLHLGANPNFKNMNQYREGWSALFYAATNPNSPGNGNKSIIRALFQGPFLHLAASSSSCSPSLMDWLVENGANANWAGGQRNETPIFYAIRNFYIRQGVECIQALLSLGADVQFRNIDGLTPLSLAVRMGSVESTRILLEHGAFPNSRDKNGKSPLHYAAETRNAHKILKLLIQSGADVNSRDMLGLTPLHKIVAKEETWEAAGELLKAGADRCAISNDGKFPHDMVPDGPWAETKRSLIRFYMA